MSRRIALASALVLALVLFPAMVLRAVSARPTPRPAHLPAIPGVDSSLASVRVDSAAGVLEVVLGPVRLAPHGMHRPAIQLVRVPAAGAFHGFAWEVTDGHGRRLSNELLHHVNLIDPDEQELFSPTVRHVFAAGRETEPRSFTPLIGYPLAAGTRLLVISMFSNPDPVPIDSVYLHVRLDWDPASRVVSALPVFPFKLDVMGPIGEKSFDVPPGRTERSWEGSPLLDARILAISGHAHDYATALRLEDATTGELLWDAHLVTRKDGTLVTVPAGMPWKTGGIELRRDHRYRVTVAYDNPTDRPAPHGGMGVVAGIAFVREAWPRVRYDDVAYRTDLYKILSGPALEAAGMGDMHMDMGAPAPASAAPAGHAHAH